MGILDDLPSILNDALGTDVFKAGVLSVVSGVVSDGRGGYTPTRTNANVRILVTEYNEFARSLGRIEDDDRKILILQHGIAVTPKPGDFIIADGINWAIQSIEQDPANATWTCRARPIADTEMVITGITGTMSVTLDDAVMVSAGVVAPGITGAIAVTLDDATMSASGIVTNGITGAISVVLADAVMVASGSVGLTISGSIDVTLDDAVMVASGSVGAGILGSMNVTLDDATMVASGTVTAGITGSMSVTLDDAVMSATGIITNGISGTLNVVLDDATMVAAGTVEPVSSISENETFWGGSTDGEMVNLESASGGAIDKDANGPMTLALKWRVKQNAATDPLYRHANSAYFAMTTGGDLLSRIQAPGNGDIVNRTDIFGWSLDEVHCLVFSTDGDSADLWVDGVQIYALRSIGKSGLGFKHPFAINATWINAANGSPKDKNIFNAWVSNDYIDLSVHGAKFYGTDLAPTQDLFDGNAIAGSTPVFAESGDAAAWNGRTGVVGTVTDVV